MKRRLLIIVLALILAVVGTSGVLSYVRGANARAIAGMKAVSVLVAQKKITSGTTAGSALHSGLLASQTLPASSVPANALSAITGPLSTQVLSADLQPGQVLSVGQAAAGGATGTSTTSALNGSSSTSSGQTGSLVTLAVSQAQAEQLIQMTETGLPYL